MATASILGPQRYRRSIPRGRTPLLVLSSARKTITAGSCRFKSRPRYTTNTLLRYWSTTVALRMRRSDRGSSSVIDHHLHVKEVVCESIPRERGAFRHETAAPSPVPNNAGSKQGALPCESSALSSGPARSSWGTEAHGIRLIPTFARNTLG